MTARWVKESRGRYRYGDHLVIRERWHIWRVWWDPVATRHHVQSGCPGDGFQTLREARADVEQEVANQPKSPPPVTPPEQGQ